MSEFAGSRWQEKISRRLFLGRSSLGIGTGVGTAALATLLGEEAVGQQGGHLCQQAGVTNRLRTAQRVTQQFGRERAMELGLL